MQSPHRGHRPPLPANIEAECLLCGTQFRNILKYYRHRDMDVPFAARTCRGINHEAKCSDE